MTDLISRQAAYETLTEYYHHRTEIKHEALKEAIDRVPSAEKKGKWIEENRRPKSSAFYCSVCHRTAYDPQNHRADVPKRCRYAYCPNCGARMTEWLSSSAK